MPTMEISDWLDEHSGPQFVWYVKRLSANDTQANGSHQAGPHIRKELLFQLFPKTPGGTSKTLMFTLC